jgi:hypothetical protein
MFFFQMKTLDENWKKAEEEVYKFDHLVDTIREVRFEQF